MTFDEIFQNYVAQGFTKPTAGVQGIESLMPTTATPIAPISTIQAPQISTDDTTTNNDTDLGIMSLDTTDYSEVPSLYSQYMRPTGIFDIIGLITNPLGYAAKNTIEYAMDQRKAAEVQEMGRDYDPYGLGEPGVDYGRAGGGGFGGGTAGGFSESDPTATEGSF